MSIWYDPLRDELERKADQIGVVADVAHAIVEERKLSLSHLKNLAARNRDRIERITARAEQLDQRGDAVERGAHTVFDSHEQALAATESELHELEKFTSEMKSQLGNS